MVSDFCFVVDVIGLEYRRIETLAFRRTFVIFDPRNDNDLVIYAIKLRCLLLVNEGSLNQLDGGKLLLAHGRLGKRLLHRALDLRRHDRYSILLKRLQLLDHRIQLAIIFAPRLAIPSSDYSLFHINHWFVLASQIPVA